MICCLLLTSYPFFLAWTLKFTRMALYSFQSHLSQLYPMSWVHSNWPLLQYDAWVPPALHHIQPLLWGLRLLLCCWLAVWVDAHQMHLCVGFFGYTNSLPVLLLGHVNTINIVLFSAEYRYMFSNWVPINAANGLLVLSHMYILSAIPAEQMHRPARRNRLGARIKKEKNPHKKPRMRWKRALGTRQ